MTQSEIQALKARLYRCWNPPVAVREALTLRERYATRGGFKAVII